MWKRAGDQPLIRKHPDEQNVIRGYRQGQDGHEVQQLQGAERGVCIRIDGGDDMGDKHRHSHTTRTCIHSPFPTYPLQTHYLSIVHGITQFDSPTMEYFVQHTCVFTRMTRLNIPPLDCHIGLVYSPVTQQLLHTLHTPCLHQRPPHQRLLPPRRGNHLLQTTPPPQRPSPPTGHHHPDFQPLCSMRLSHNRWRSSAQ